MTRRGVLFFILKIIVLVQRLRSSTLSKPRVIIYRYNIYIYSLSGAPQNVCALCSLIYRLVRRVWNVALEAWATLSESSFPLIFIEMCSCYWYCYTRTLINTFVVKKCICEIATRIENLFSLFSLQLFVVRRIMLPGPARGPRVWRILFVVHSYY